MNKWVWCAALCLAVLWFDAASAQIAAGGSEQAAPVVTDAAPLTVITQYSLPPNLLTKAQALYSTRVTLYVVSSVYGLLVLVFIIGSRLGARFRDSAERISRKRYVQAMVFAPLLVLAVDVLTLPLNIFGHHLRLSYDLSVQGWSSWAWDWVKNELVGIVIATLLVWGLYALLRASPRRWWLWGWLASIPIVLVLVFIQPVLIDPLFNDFAPLEAKQPQLLPQIEKVMARGGLHIERSRMFEMRASDKVTTYNAYVTGIGASKRVVVWDNTARDMTIPETLFVFGHEQGHYVLHHIWLSLALAIIGLFIGFVVLYGVMDTIIARWGARFGIRDVCDWASLPLMLLVLNVLMLFAQPVTAAYSRYLEHQADIYALEVVHGIVPDASQAGTQAFQKLGEKGLAYPDPNPFFVFWAYDHPPVADRIRFAATYRPWAEGKPGKYIK